MGIAYKKFEPTEYVIRVKKGRIVQKGLGLSFFNNTMTASMTVILATAFAYTIITSVNSDSFCAASGDIPSSVIR